VAWTEEEIGVKFVATLVAICALSQTAAAQTPECKSISNPSARLACYDKTNSTTASSAAAKPALRVPEVRKGEGGTYVDQISAEDALMNAQLKNICRGC
jgi:hypothetical protein